MRVVALELYRVQVLRDLLNVLVVGSVVASLPRWTWQFAGSQMESQLMVSHGSASRTSAEAGCGTKATNAVAARRALKIKGRVFKRDHHAAERADKPRTVVAIIVFARIEGRARRGTSVPGVAAHQNNP